MFWIVLAGLLGQASQPSHLDTIIERGHINVGTTGDYRPFSYRRSDGSFEGIDIDAAHALGEALGVEVKFVETSWPRLVAGIHEGRYDIAMSGITRTLERQKSVGLTDAYFTLGKCPLIRKSDRERFPDLEAIDRPGVKIGVNPGGTNEAFVRKHIRNAAIIVFENNLAIPSAVASAEVDVMLTDNVEAVLASRENERLHAVSPDEPLTRDELAYMLPRGDPAFRNWLDLWIHRMKLTGDLDRIRQKWLGASPSGSLPPGNGVDLGLGHRRQQRLPGLIAMPGFVVNAKPEPGKRFGSRTF
ncbi:MAG: transporter substrate-binding domain-containing protein [Acidobacteriota bacterium]|nr:MAG: transporter substrate-binding domain-containing protein [Acidobacteriota bacterium]